MIAKSDDVTAFSVLGLMGCLHSKNKKEIDDLDSVKNDVFFSAYDSSVDYDNYDMMQAPAKPPPDYSKIETPEILKLREKLKELDVAGQDEVGAKQLRHSNNFC